jgi:hypothetical protein
VRYVLIAHRGHETPAGQICPQNESDECLKTIDHHFETGSIFEVSVYAEAALHLFTLRFIIFTKPPRWLQLSYELYYEPYNLDISRLESRQHSPQEVLCVGVEHGGIYLARLFR